MASRRSRSSSSRPARHRHTAQPTLELLEDRSLMDAGLWMAVFGGLASDVDLIQQAQVVRNHLDAAGVDPVDIQVVEALDLTGTVVLQTRTSWTQSIVTDQLDDVAGFIFAQEYFARNPDLPSTERQQHPKKGLSEAMHGPFDYAAFVERERRGEVPDQSGPAESDPYNVLTNNNSGSTGTANFTQSETAILAFGSTVLIGFNDSGSNAGGTNKFTGWSRSTDGGTTFTDDGTLPTNAIGDAGDPVLARDNTTGRIYFSTLGFSSPGTIQMFRSNDNGATWLAPVNATPGGTTEDKQWHVVDNFAGSGNGNVYLLSRRFAGTQGIYFFRSTDGGATFGPNGGTLITTGSQGAYIAVGTDHSVYAFWFAGTSILMRKSTDQGLTFGATTTVASGLTAPEVNGGLGLTGQRAGTTFLSGFRSNSFPHVAVNPVNGHLYVVYNDNPAGTDKGDIFFRTSTDGGATWGTATRINTDAGLNDQWQPTLAVTPDGTKVGVFWYDRREDTGVGEVAGDLFANNTFKYYGRVGNISGGVITWGADFAVSDVASLPEFGRDTAVNTVYMGDYDMAAATNDAFHVVWSDSRSALPGGAPRQDPNVFYKKISLGLSVTTTTPAVGSTVGTIPLSYVVNFSEAITPGSVQATDFTVDGNAATSFLINDADTVTFTFAAPPFTLEGSHTMAMAAGSVTRLGDGSPLNAFSGAFLYDAVGLTVTSTVPPSPGGIFTLPGPFSYVVNFNEDILGSSVSLDDLALSAGTVTAAVKSGVGQATYTIGGITTEQALPITLGAGKVSDLSGNPNPAAFVGTYVVDIGTVAYPVPLAAKGPLGSLVYDPTTTGIIGSPGDTDNFTISIDPNQKITVFLDPAVTLQGTIRLFDGANVLIGTATSGAAGLDAVIQTVATGAGTQTYRIEVSGAAGTTGGYTLGVVLNAREEDERRNGPANDAFATAEEINGSFIGLGGAASRGAVLGTGAVGNNDYYQFAVTAGDTLTLALQSLSGGVVEVRLFDPSNNLLGQAVGGASNVSRLLSNLVAPVSGSYRALVTTTTPTTYNLVVLKNVDFDREANDSFAAAQYLGGADGALGHVTAGVAGLGRVYVYEAFGTLTNVIREINPTTGAVLNTFTSPTGTPFSPDAGLATTPTSLLVANDANGNVYELNPNTGAVLRTITTSVTSIAGLAFLNNEIYIRSDAGSITVLNYTTGAVARTFSSPTISEDLAASANKLYGTAGASLYEVNTLTGAVTFVGTLSGTGFAEGLGVVGNELFVADFSVVRVYNLSTLALLRTLTGYSDLEAVGADGGSPANDDWHSFAVNAGDSLALQTSTPADGTGEFVNLLNPKIELYNPSGILVASGTVLGDGRNEQILHAATATGLYRVRVLAEGGTGGEYFVSVAGNTGTTAGPAFQVTATNPVNGANLLVSPTTYTVDFNDAVLVSSLNASDLKVNGVDALGFTVVDGDTVNFTLAGGLPNGTYTVTIAAGAILDAQGTPIQAFSATFTVDSVAPRVLATNVAPNAILPPGNLTYTVTFSEPMRTTNLTSDDFTLHGNFRQAVGVNYAPSSFSFNGAGTVLTLNYVGLPDDDYTLTLNSSSVAFVDVVGNLLDGEFTGTFPSGNGVQGGNFVIGFDMDLATEAYPALVAKPPLGSLIYDPTITRTIAFAGDVDNFTLNIDPGQTISIVVTPNTAGLQPRVELFDPSNASLGFASAPAAGQVTGIQTRATTTGGVYRIQVSGLGGTQGLYTVQVILNAAFEQEGKVVGSTNNTLLTAQDINGSVISLDTTLAHATRGAVLGRLGTGPTIASENFESGSLPASITTGSFTPTGLPDPQGRIRVKTPDGTGNPSAFALMMDRSPDGVDTLNEAIWTVDLTGVTVATLSFSHVQTSDETHALPLDFVGRFNGDGVAISANGVNWRTILSAPTNATWTNFSVDLVAAASAAGMSLGPNFKIKFQQFDNFAIPTDGRGYDNLLISGAEEDWYSMTLGAGDRATVALKGLTAGTVNVALVNAGGMTLATGVAGPTNLDKVISNFAVPTAGTYYLKVTGSQNTDYSLTLTKDAVFDAETNNTQATAQEATGSQGALGHVVSGAGGSLLDLPGTIYTGTRILTGTKIALGFNTDGSFITSTAGGTGIRYNGVEFVIPGVPVASFTVSRDGVNFTNNLANGVSQIAITELKDVSAGSFRGVKVTGIAGGNLRVERVVGFNTGDDHVTIQTRLTNVGAVAMANVATLENIDPDPDSIAFGNPSTLNDVVLANEFVRASGPSSGLTVGLGSADSRRVVSAEGFDNRNPFDIINSPADPNGASGDIGIALAFNVGALAVGGSTTTTGIMAFGTSGAAADAVYTANKLGTAVGDDDWYKVTLAAGETVLEVETRTPADGPGQFVNLLNPKIQVFNAGGTDITGTVTILGDGRNEKVRITGLTPGATYFVKVTGEGGTAGEYFVGVKALKTPTPTVLVDNTNPVAFRVFGAGWNTLTNPNDGDGGYGTNARWHAGNGTSATYAEWRYGQNFVAGTSYEFYVTWDADPANASDATYSIYDGVTLIGTVVLNQKLAPNDAVFGATTWERLFVFTPATTGYKVISTRLSGMANGRVVADALFDPPLEEPGSAAATASFAATATTVGPAPAGRAFAALGTLDVGAGRDPLGAARVETALVEPIRDAAFPRRDGRSLEARVSDDALTDRAWLSSLVERPAVADLAVANADDEPADTLPTDDLQPANALLLAGRAQTLAADTLFRRAGRTIDRASADADDGIDPALDGAQEGEEI